jgi:excisionase family DNA binding protein
MTTLDKDRLMPPELTPDDVAMVSAAQRMIMESLDHGLASRISLVSDEGSTPAVSVPPQVLKFLGQVLGLMSQRRPIMLMPQKQELSTVEVANFLNVSRPFVIKEIDAGRLKHRKVGSHRRVLYEDLMEYAATMRAMQEAALDRMAANARELGLSY